MTKKRKMRSTTKAAAPSGAYIDWDRELCKQGCEEWVPWYRGSKGKMVYGCRIGEVSRKLDGQWYCRPRKLTRKNKGTET